VAPAAAGAGDDDATQDPDATTGNWLAWAHYCHYKIVYDVWALHTYYHYI